MSKSSSAVPQAAEQSEQKPTLPSLNEKSCESHTVTTVAKHSSVLDPRLYYPGSPCWSPTLMPCSFVGPASPSHWVTGTSVMLSPSPSSLGSSREELSVVDSSRLTVIPSSQVTPWPPPIWHCFQPGKYKFHHIGFYGWS
jgi:hypothetical protein